MDDTTRIALIREVLSTYTLNCEDEDGDRNLTDRSLCINAMDDIANAADPDLEDLERDGWISPATAARGIATDLASTAADIAADIRLMGQACPASLEHARDLLGILASEQHLYPESPRS